MTTLDRPRCPRCGSHDVAVTALARHDTGARFAVTCDQCATTLDTWHPRPLAQHEEGSA